MQASREPGPYVSGIYGDRIARLWPRRPAVRWCDAVHGGAAPSTAGLPGRRGAARVLITAQDCGYLPARKTVSPHQDIMLIRIIALSWSPVTESNRRPSPYHRVPIGVPTRHFAGRPDQTLRFSPVGRGSGRFAPDATSQSPPNQSRRRSPCPAPVSPSPISVRYTPPTPASCAHRGIRSSNSAPKARGSSPATAATAREWRNDRVRSCLRRLPRDRGKQHRPRPSACPRRQPYSPWRASRRMSPTGTPTRSSGHTARAG